MATNFDEERVYTIQGGRITDITEKVMPHKMTHKMSDYYSKELIEACKPYENVKFEEEEWEEEEAKAIEKLSRIEQIINKPLNRAKGSVSIRELREVIG